jgi:hypothetical protein
VSSLAQVVQLPKTFCGNEGVLECSGLTELWMGIERVDGKIQSGVKPPQSKKPESGLNFWKMINFASWREIPSPSSLRPTPLSDFKFQVSVSPQVLDSRLSTQSPYLRDTPTAGFRFIDPGCLNFCDSNRVNTSGGFISVEISGSNVYLGHTFLTGKCFGP